MNKFEVIYLIDVVSTDEKDYVRKKTVEAENDVEALKQAAIQLTGAEHTSTIEFIKNLKGDFDNIMKTLMPSYCIVACNPVK